MRRNLLYESKKFFKKNGSTILTVIGSVGVIGTAIVAATSTPKALLLLEDAKKEKGDELTVVEKVIKVFPVYIPTAAIGLSTIACIFGANILNKRQIASLTGAYMMLDSSYREYKKKVAEVLGEDGERAVRDEIAKDHMKEAEKSTNSDKLTFYDEYSNRYFERTMAEYQDAIYHFNRNFVLRGYAELNEFYNFLDLPGTEIGSEIGWSEAAGGAWYGYSWVDFELVPVKMDDGFECYIIRMPFEPTIDYLEY